MEYSRTQEQFIVVINDEEQYSLWPVSQQVPRGWSEVGVRGSRQECLAYIDEVWTDMRPLSLRQQMNTHSR